ncbi:hypothetical protein [Amycolatopsis sp. NPDC054798]
MRMRSIGRALFVVVAAAAALSPWHGTAFGEDPRPGTAAETGEPAITEDFDYPGAAAILAEKGVVLHKGDGNILLADCGQPDVIEVHARSKAATCFRASGPTGWLTLEIPEAYLVKADRHALDVDVTVKGTTKTYSVPKNDSKPVGEGETPANGPGTLLRITARA